MLSSLRCASSLATAAARAKPQTALNAAAVRFMSSDNPSATFDLTGSFETYNLDTAPEETIEMDKEELMQHFKTMYTVRRMEITCDNGKNVKTLDAQKTICENNSFLQIKSLCLCVLYRVQGT
mmetsp:Transcript_14011/g.20524  ORF Transcript_14011/g.20524 Transcript_14011/m.20524 type:complete len:123 (+) Transcript_14011:170-538(+)